MARPGRLSVVAEQRQAKGARRRPRREAVKFGDHGGVPRCVAQWPKGELSGKEIRLEVACSNNATVSSSCARTSGSTRQ
jgi:hypothetical protein